MNVYEYVQPTNRKITINEVDTTQPRGEGTSSDIVYIPGLAYEYLTAKVGETVQDSFTHEEIKKLFKTDYTVLDLNGTLDAEGQYPINYEETAKKMQADGWETDAPTYSKDTQFKKRLAEPNVPYYCTSVSQFESLFGTMPYEYTELDLKDPKDEDTERLVEAMGDAWKSTSADGNSHKIVDPAYIYAKELLSSGLSIYYENIQPNSSAPEIGALDTTTLQSETVELHTKGGGTFDSDFVITFNPSFSNLFSINSSLPTMSATQSYDFIYGGYNEYDPLSSITQDIRKVTVTISANKVDKQLKIDLNNLSDTATITSTELGVGADGAAICYTLEGKINDDPKTFSKITLTAKLLEINASEKDLAVTLNTILQQTELNMSVEMIEDYMWAPVEGTAYISCTTSSSYSVPSSWTFTEDQSRITYFYKNVVNSLKRIADKSEYTIKYITLGGYPVLTLQDTINKNYLNKVGKAMTSAAATRGDAVAILDHADNIEAPLGVNKNSIYDALNENAPGYENNEYGTMFTPWGNYSTFWSTLPMPASYGYLKALATAIKTQPNWLAIAGVARGSVPGLLSLRTKTPLNNTIAEDYQPKFGDGGKNSYSMNAITDVKPYGLTLWGNRTLAKVDPKGTTSQNFLNTRNMISDIKKLSYTTAKSLMFEQDSDMLWLRFKSGITPLLDRLKGGYGISDYKIIKLNTKFNGQSLTNGEIAAVIKICPLYAIEYFEITVQIADQDVAVS